MGQFSVTILAVAGSNLSDNQHAVWFGWSGIDFVCVWLLPLRHTCNLAPLASTVLPRILGMRKPRCVAGRKVLLLLLDLVAGTGFEPVTFRL
ncbi:hypothetical protein BG454_06725 [Roseinatronobacter bogoriensis subsp. barguzinensis]|uniref:Uncharacterized protein n=1 Tax=Roseinatronobacter bogoriensis subsp. barguzinensis TaxID=441209 RepID=A0A2K8K7X8_9RHOB|nr:hypothetical protein BG454_06725 [Rhodobaca barguzinensis]TDY65661.1 hypothetical protein EV660_1188 [Rhodobaca bogoriensis DSM 18756]